ncbi:aminoglycoside phosphotransferase [Erwinia endophytica]|uniref:phosphotransferase n=1 Tax=Erwinia endophytica TaxID=1563158 RepID=UPI001265F861|nr:phosphotransferase [Erwinia endophytica]KAB8307404.1 aminoglycoside phosphotransferase [Erwinia endophytica]
MLSRLQQALHGWQPDSQWSIQPGTPGVASPHRLATEWAGFRLHSGTQPLYAKVLQDDQRRLIDVQRSIDASRAAAEIGLTPAVHYADVAQGVVIYTALDTRWHWARLDQLMQPRHFTRLTRLLDQLHEINLALPSRQDDMRHLRQRCREDGVIMSDELNWLGECVDLAWQALNQQPHPAVLIHGDPIASNWLVNEQGDWQLLDFDYASLGDAWYDIAVLLNERMLFDHQWREAIAAWHGKCTEADYARCRLYALADDYYWTLWGLWNGHCSSRGLEFAKVGQWTLLRCRQSARDSRFERWLALVAGSAA